MVEATSYASIYLRHKQIRRLSEYFLKKDIIFLYELSWAIVIDNFQKFNKKII
jgi:hypothetical protein